jgi:hypothetical protein
MNSGQVSFFLMIIGLMTAAFMIAHGRPGWKKSSAGIISGVVIGLVNMVVEYLAAQHRVYSVSGLMMVGSSSLALTVGWMSVTACYTLYSESLREYPSPGIAFAIYLAAGIVGGIVSDYLGQIATGHFRMGPNGTWLYIGLIWLALVPAAVIIYKAVLKIIG